MSEVAAARIKAMTGDRAVVGSSSHTPPKHQLYNDLSGMIVGAAPGVRRPQPIDHVLLIDACAGDGAANAFSGMSSPAIIAKHLAFMREDKRYLNRQYRPITGSALLIEQSPAHVAALRAAYGSDPGMTILQGDYRSDEIAAEVAGMIQNPATTTVFLQVDPNNVNDVVLSDSLARVLGRMRTTMMITMGCNASGVKRLSYREGREHWFPNLAAFTEMRLRHHDVALVSLARDDHQWAYLASAPAVWRDKVDKAVSRLEKLWPKGVNHVWLSQDRAGFQAVQDELFLTKKERRTL